MGVRPTAPETDLVTLASRLVSFVGVFDVTHPPVSRNLLRYVHGDVRGTPTTVDAKCPLAVDWEVFQEVAFASGACSQVQETTA